MKESKHTQLNEAKWDKWAGSYDGESWRNNFLRKAQSIVVSLLDVKENMTFLDIGCGTGWAIGQVAKLIDGKGSFYGVDLSSKMIEKAKENFKDKENFHFIKSNAESIPLDDSLFDTIICTNSFHHYLNPDKALKEIYRLLKTGGKIYILNPNADFWFIKILDKISWLFDHAHVKLYTTKEFKRLFAGAGLKYVGCEKAEANQIIHVGEK